MLLARGYGRYVPKDSIHTSEFERPLASEKQTLEYAQFNGLKRPIAALRGCPSGSVFTMLADSKRLIMNCETLVISEADGVAHIQLNRPENSNAINGLMWKEIGAAFDWLSTSHA